MTGQQNPFEQPIEPHEITWDYAALIKRWKIATGHPDREQLLFEIAVARELSRDTD